MKTIRLVFMTLFFAAWQCGAEEAKPNEKPLADVKKEIAEGKAVLIDVREPNEWEAGHVKDAKSIPLSSINAGKADLAALPTDKTVYTYCRMGKRAQAAATLLAGKGYHATPLKQGFEELSINGFEPTK